MGARRLRAPRDGHPRPGQRVDRRGHTGSGRLRPGATRVHDARDRRSARPLLPPRVRGRRPRRRGGLQPRRGRSRPGCRLRRESGGRRRSRRRGARAGDHRAHVRRPVPVPHRTRRRARDGGPVRRGHALPTRSSRRPGAGVPDAVVRRRGRVRPARAGPCAVLGRADGPDLPSLDGVRRLQRLLQGRSRSRPTPRTSTKAEERRISRDSSSGCRRCSTPAGPFGRHPEPARAARSQPGSSSAAVAPVSAVARGSERACGSRGSGRAPRSPTAP